MWDKRMYPHVVTYRIVYNAIVNAESTEKATEFFKQMQSKWFKLEDDCSCNHFGEHLAEMLWRKKLFDDLWEKTTDKCMQEVFFNWQKSRYQFEDEKLMCAALKEDGNEDEIQEIVNSLNRSVRPPLIYYTGIIQIYVRDGKMKCALEVYEDMLAAGIAPNSFTYTVLIKGFTTDPKFYIYAKKCLLEMMDNGKKPNAATYTAVIECLAKQEDQASKEECEKLVEHMIHKGFIPSAKDMLVVLKGRPRLSKERILKIVLDKLRG